MVALFADVRDNARNLSFFGDSFDEPQVDRCRGDRRNDIGGLFANASARNTANVERGQVNKLAKRFAAAVYAREPEFLLLHVVAAILAYGLQFNFVEGHDAIIEILNQHAAITVLHRGEQLRQHHSGIRRPVAIVTAVQRAFWPEYGELEFLNAARAELDRQAAARVFGTVA